MEVLLDLLRSGRLSRLVADRDYCHDGDEWGGLAMMNEDILPELCSPNEARYQRYVSWIREGSGQRTNDSKQFWHLRYEVQEIPSPFHTQSQKDISARLTTLHRLSRFDTKAIHKVKLRQVELPAHAR
jgi:hypothetical protein